MSVGACGWVGCVERSGVVDVVVNVSCCFVIRKQKKESEGERERKKEQRKMSFSEGDRYMPTAQTSIKRRRTARRIRRARYNPGFTAGTAVPLPIWKQTNLSQRGRVYGLYDGSVESKVKSQA